MTDLADNTAATSAGYRRIQEDRGAGKSPRYVSRYEKQMKGELGQGGFLVRQEGYSDVSQAAADTTALAALNGFRKHRYGIGASANRKSRPDSGSSYTQTNSTDPSDAAVTVDVS
jgi:hypothetical protein